MNPVVVQLFPLSMDEQETRDDEEGRPEDEEAEVKISTSYIFVNPLLPFYRKAQLIFTQLVIHLCKPLLPFCRKAQFILHLCNPLLPLCRKAQLMWLLLWII